jgi:hypothetical protein
MTCGLVCLQGGAEFGSACRDLDEAVLRRTPPGPVVVLTAAAEGPRAQAQVGRNAARWFGRLGADRVLVSPDPLEDPDGAVETIAEAALVALPGGSPARLLDAVRGPVGEALAACHAAGVTLWGASAGAMVLCDLTVVPDRGRAAEAGLGIVPGLALPHWSGSDRFGLVLPPQTPRWGLPECGGVLVHDGTAMAAGAGEPVVLVDGTTTILPRDHPIPVPGGSHPG